MEKKSYKNTNTNNSQPNKIRGGETNIMKNNMKKTLAVLSTTAMLAGVAVPAATMVAPTVVSADSTNIVTKTPSVADDFKGHISDLYIREDHVPFTADATFRLQLPTGVKWDKDSVPNAVYAEGTSTVVATLAGKSDQVLEYKTTAGIGAVSDTVGIDIPLNVKVDGAEGELKVTVDGRDTTITSGTYTFGYAANGNTVSFIDEVRTIGQTDEIGTIQIDETAIGSILNDNDMQEVTLKLPADWDWKDSAGLLGLGGGFVASGVQVKVYDQDGALKDTLDNTNLNAMSNYTAIDSHYISESGRTLKFFIQVVGTPSARGTLIVRNPQITADDDANYGDVEVTVDGDKVKQQDITVAKYATWNAEATIDEVKDVVAGKLDDNLTDLITLEETVPGSVINNRTVTVELPEDVEISEVKDFDGSDFGATYSIKDNKLKIDIASQTGSSTGKVEFKLRLSVKSDFTGDVAATISGAGVQEQEITVAKVIAPVTVTTDNAAPLKIGIQDQSAPDIVITENVKGALEKYYEETDGVISSNKVTITSGGNNGELKLWLDSNSGVTFEDADVEVLEGNGELGDVSINNGVITIPVKSESSKPMKFKLTNVQVTVDRTVPEGPINLSVGGNGLVENADVSEDQALFDTSKVVKFEYANVVTPAPGETKASAAFVIGDTTYSVGGVEKAMDVAPFIANGRTYLPLRYVADALGVSEDNIIWNQAAKTVTVMKGDRVAQLTVGSNILTVNGVQIPMDVKAEVKDGRTVLPIRFVAQALGAQVNYDEVTKTVTVQ